jgi:hypothetical protein
VFSPEHWANEVPENLIVASELRKLPRKYKVITKCLANEGYTSFYDNVVTSDRNKPDHFKIVADVLSTADVVVCISESTFELLAESLDIPVVAFTHWIPKASNGDDRYKEYKRIYSDGCYQVSDISKLNETIERAYRRGSEMTQARLKAVKDDSGSFMNPIKNIADEIERL